MAFLVILILISPVIAITLGVLLIVSCCKNRKNLKKINKLKEYNRIDDYDYAFLKNSDTDDYRPRSAETPHAPQEESVSHTAQVAPTCVPAQSERTDVVQPPVYNYNNQSVGNTPTVQNAAPAQSVPEVKVPAPATYTATKATGDTLSDEQKKALSEYHKTLSEQKTEPAVQVPEPKRKHSVSTINVVLIVGTLFIILSGLIFATTTWQILGNGIRGAIIVALTAMFYAASAVSEKKFKLDRTGLTFFVLGSIFMPITLVAVGFFRLFGDWFSFFGDGRYLLLALTFAMLCVSTAVGAIKYKLSFLSICSLISMTASVCCFILSATGWNDTFSLLISIYALIVTLSGKFISKSTNTKLSIITNMWSVFSLCNVAILSIFGMIFSGNGIIACISVLLFSFIFLDKDLNSDKKSFGIFAFVFFFAAGLYKILVPDNASGFFYICAMLSAAVLLLGFMNFYSDFVKKVCNVVCICTLSASLLLGMVSSTVSGWTIGQLVSVLFLIAISLYYIIAKKQKLMGILFAALSALLFDGIGAMIYGILPEKTLVVSLLCLVTFTVLFAIRKNPIRSVCTDAVFLAMISYFGIFSLIATSYFGGSPLLSMICIFAAFTVIAMLSIEKKENALWQISRWALPIYPFFAAFPLSEMLYGTSLEPEWAYMLYYLIILAATLVMFALRKKSYTAQRLLLPFKTISLTAGLIMSIVFASIAYAEFSLFCSASLLMTLALYSAFSERLSTRIAQSALSAASSLLVLISLCTFEIEFSITYFIWFSSMYALWLVLYFFGRKSERMETLSYSFTALVAFIGLIGQLMTFLPVLPAAMLLAFSVLLAFADRHRILRAVGQYLLPLSLAVSVFRVTDLIADISFSGVLVIWFAIFCAFGAVCFALRRKRTVFSEFSTIILLYALVSLIAFVIATLIGTYTASEATRILVIAVWLGTALLTFFITGEENKKTFFFPLAWLYSFAVFVTSGLIFSSDNTIIALYITFAFIIAAALVAKIFGKIPFREELFRFCGTSLEVVSVISMITAAIVSPESIVVAIIAPITALLSYIYALLRKKNALSSVSSVGMAMYLIYFGVNYCNGNGLYFLIMFTAYAAAGRLLHKKLLQKDENIFIFDWLTLTALIPLVTLIIAETSDGWHFVEALCVALYPLLFINKLSWKNCTRILISISGALMCVAWWLLPIEIPSIISFEYNFVALVLYCFGLWLLWKNGRAIIESCGFALAISGIVHMIFDIFTKENLIDSLILLAAVAVMLVISFIVKKRRWFVLSVSLLLVVTLFMTKEFWQSLAWWVYLLVVGVLLIVIAAVNELGRQKSAVGDNPARDKIKRFMDEWTW